MEKMHGFLVFDERDGKFGFSSSPELYPHTLIEFGQEFEVSTDGGWVRTNLEIANNEKGELIFKLKNTDYSGDINGLEIREI